MDKRWSFQQMAMEQVDIYMQKKNLDRDLNPSQKVS